MTAVVRISSLEGLGGWRARAHGARRGVWFSLIPRNALNPPPALVQMGPSEIRLALAGVCAAAAPQAASSWEAWGPGRKALSAVMWTLVSSVLDF